MKQLTIQLDESDSRFVWEALAALERQWDDICAKSDDPDEIADYGNDLIALRILIESYKSQAVAAFGPSVLNTSRDAL